MYDIMVFKTSDDTKILAVSIDLSGEVDIKDVDFHDTYFVITGRNKHEN